MGIYAFAISIFSISWAMIFGICIDYRSAESISIRIVPEPTGVSPGRGLLIPLGYLHPGKCEHSEVQSHPPLCNGRWMVFVVMRMRESSLI